MPTMQRRMLLVALPALALPPTADHAQAFPSRPIPYIMPVAEFGEAASMQA
jgi:hypothetical protein